MVNHLSARRRPRPWQRALKTYRARALGVDEVGYVSLRQPESTGVSRSSPPGMTGRSQPCSPRIARSGSEPDLRDDAVAHADLGPVAERTEVFHLEGRAIGKPRRRRSEGQSFVSGGPVARVNTRRARWAPRLWRSRPRLPRADRDGLDWGAAVPSRRKSDGLDGGASIHSLRKASTRTPRRRLGVRPPDSGWGVRPPDLIDPASSQPSDRFPRTREARS